MQGEMQIEMADVVAVMQQEFPKEYTICVQRVHITKLEQMLNEKDVPSMNGEREPASSDDLQ